jgi:predicted ATP-binding protein involved in virulence
MKLQSLCLENVGCIRNLSLEDINPKINVITGPNGVGKTTLLKAICSILTSTEGVQLKRNVQSEQGYIEATLINGQGMSRKKQKIEQYSPNDNDYTNGFGLGKKLIYIADNRELDYVMLQNVPRDIIKPDYKYKKEILVYPEQIKGWFINRYLFSAHPGSLSDSQMANFELAKSAFSILDNSVQFEKVDSHSLDIILNTSFGSIYFEYLSSGFKSVIILVLGIIKEIEFRLSDSNVKVADFDGIVVIDEIELHLHPTWQAKIVRTLLELFPQIQFFISTHSPHVVQSLSPGELIALEKSEDNIVRRELPVNETGYIGWTVEEILRDVMGISTTYPDNFQNLWEAFTASIGNEDISEAYKTGKQLLKMLHPANILRKVIELQLTSLAHD